MRWVPWIVLLAACAGSPGAGTAATTIDVATTTLGVGEAASSTSLTPPVDAAAVQPEGFALVAALVVKADGTECEICVWLADTPDQRSRGLMHVTDLGPADAMAFRYPDPHTGTFWMKNTVMPLSIAFHSPTGQFLASFDMEPCTLDSCPNYPTATDFQIAVEVPQGGLGALGLGSGSTFELLDLPCAD